MQEEQLRVINKLLYLVEKYKRLKGIPFLFNYKIFFTPETKIELSIISYDAKVALKESMDVGETKEAGEAKEVNLHLQNYYSLARYYRPGRKYCIMKGEEVARHLYDLLNQLKQFYLVPCNVLINEELPPFHDISSFYFKDEKKRVPGKKKITCSNRASCAFVEFCPQAQRIQYSGSAGVKILQQILLKMGYFDEMRYEKYWDDGKKGPRTRLAINSFAAEVNFLEGLKLPFVKDVSLSRVTNKAVVAELKKRCEYSWERRAFYHFTDEKWDLSAALLKYSAPFNRGRLEDELVWLKNRYHLRQLQESFRYFFLLSEFSFDWIELADIHQLEQARLDFETSVEMFRFLAARGGRFDPIKREIVYPYSKEPTYTGVTEGPFIVDRAFKEEVKRWYEYIEHIVDVPGLDRFKGPMPEVELSGIRIISPMLACSQLVKEGEEIEIILSTPQQIEANSREITAELLTDNLPYYLFIHRPRDEKRPFLFDEYYPSYTKEEKIAIQSCQLLSEQDEKELRLFSSITVEQTPFDCIASQDDKYLEYDLSEEPNSQYSQDVFPIIHSMYKRRLFTEVVPQIHWKVTVKLTDKLRAGLYLLKVRGSGDLAPHPIKIFAGDKERYSVLHLSDLHIAARFDEIPDYIDSKNYINPNDQLRKRFIELKEYNLEQKPDFIIITGDVVDCAHSHRPYEAKDGRYHFRPEIDRNANWRLLHHIVTACPGVDIPIFITPGDHDHRFNPAPLPELAGQLKLTETEAEAYPYDSCQPDKDLEEIFRGWTEKRCAGDTLYADSAALDYYFKHFCPFYDYTVTIAQLNFILMNTGRAVKTSLKDFELKALELAAHFDRVKKGELKPSLLEGLNQEQLAWLDKKLKSETDYMNILCMHAPLINPPDDAKVTDLKAEEGSFFYLESQITESELSSDEALLMKNGRDEVLAYVESSKISMVLCGHLHYNLDLKYATEELNRKWYVGNYSQGDTNRANLEDKKDNYVFTIRSSAITGYSMQPDLVSGKMRKVLVGPDRGALLLELGAGGGYFGVIPFG